MEKNITMRHTVAILFVAVLCLSAQAEQEPESGWDTLTIDVSRLKVWGTQSFRYSTGRRGKNETKAVGAITLTTEMTEEAIILKDNLLLEFKGEAISLKTTHTCLKDSYLTPIRIESSGEGTEEFKSFVATIEGGEAAVSFANGKDGIRSIQEGTITTAAMMRLVTLVPHTPGKAYSFSHSLESEELNLKSECRLIVLQPEAITVGERKVKCTKLKLEGKALRPVFYWVSKDNVLQRVLIDGRKVLELQESE